MTVRKTQQRDCRICDRKKALAGVSERYILDADYNVLGAGALKNNIKVKEAVLPNIKVMEKEAFCSCSALRWIEFPHVTEIREGAFANCSNLKAAVFPDSLKKLGGGAFYKCKRMRTADFTGNESVKVMTEMVFAECRQLENLILPANLKEIQNGAFFKCEGLKEIQLPDGLLKIGEKAFYQCGLQTLHLPETLEQIGDCAFMKCKSLEYVRIPASVRRIGKWAFHGCSKLKLVEFVRDPEEIGEWVTNKDCTLRCQRGSRMEAYAKEYGMRTEALQEP